MGRSIIIAGAALLAAALAGCIVPASDDDDDDASLAETSTVENLAQRTEPQADRVAPSRALGPQQDVTTSAPAVVDGAPCRQRGQCVGRTVVLPGMPVEGPGPEAAQ